MAGQPTEERGREYWQKMGHEAIFAAAWQMVVEAELKKGKTLEDLTMDRSVHRLIRRKRPRRT